MIIMIEFQLSFRLPVQSGLEFVTAYSFADIKTTFINKNLKIITIDEAGEREQREVCHTVMKLEYSPNDSLVSEKDISVLLHYVVVNCLGYINLMLDALRTANSLSNIRNISIADLPDTIDVYVDGDLYIYATKPIGIINDNETELDGEALKKAGKFLDTWDKYPQIALIERFYESAKAYIEREEFVQAIIELQTSFEIFIRNTFRLILIKNEATEADINRLIGIAFRNLIEQHLSKYLKADLSFKREGPIKDWAERLYSKRNGIVHLGRIIITGNQVYAALDAYVAARNYITKLLENEGYIINGKVELKIFAKNIPNQADNDVLAKRLHEKGFLPNDIPITLY